MAGVTVTVNDGVLTRAAQLAFRRAVQELEAALPAAHERDVYTWDQQTRRANGDTVGSPRDVVDRGTLRDSQQPAQYAGPFAARIDWTAEYAAATYLGAVFKTRKDTRPPRNVPRDTLTRLPLHELFQKHLAALL